MKSLCAVLMALFLLACGGSQRPEPNLDQKLGQMMVLGFRGMELGPAHPLLGDLRDRHLGGVVLFDRDVPSTSWNRNITHPAQLRHLVEELQGQSQEPLFVMVDQEGGLIARLKEKYAFPPPAPSPQSLGDKDDLYQTGLAAEGTARTLMSMGFNVNLAPVVDLNVNPDCPVIGKLGRSFGADPARVVRHAGMTLDRFHAFGLLGALKHFPGHGSSTSDSHQGFTDITNTWTEIELEPYRQLMALNKCDMVMTAHVFNAHLDPIYPATLSQAILNGLLRKKLGWQGVIVTDDMGMGAISQLWDLETTLERSVNAGADLLLFANNGPGPYDPQLGERIFSTLRRLVQEGRISEARVDESFGRIQALKSRWAPISPQP